VPPTGGKPGLLPFPDSVPRRLFLAGNDERRDSAVDPSSGSPGPLSLLLQDLAQATPGVTPGEGKASLEPGDRIGRFEILREIGRGGFGLVFEARDTGLRRSIALKLLRPGARLRTPALEASILREAEAVARLAHPTIVTLHDFGTCAAGPYLIMELLQGESLQRRLRREPIPLREALRISVELARALDHAHGAGILHRDLKPGNLFLTSSGEVKVLDFGLALVLGSSARLAGGTPAYSPPEQWRDGHQDGRTDVWSAAVILYRLLTGELPFDPDHGWMEGQGADSLTVPSIPGAPSSLAPLLLRALSLDPAPRPVDGRAWLQALREVQSELDAGPRAQARLTRIAVLPFTDLGAAGPADFLAGSLTELLISELARVPALRVTARTTTMAYRGSPRPLREIAAEMSVDKLIEGSVLRTGDLLQINVRLLDAASESQEWTERYRQPIGNVLEVLDGVVTEVAGALGALLGPARPGSGEGRSVDPRAMDGHLRGQYHQGKRTPEGFGAALAEYRASVDADPLFAAPHVGMAFVHTMSAIYGYAPTRQALSTARFHAERALALDPGRGDALGALAGVQLFHDHDFPAALATARRAVEAGPSHVMPRVVLGDALWVYDEVEPAMGHIRAALRLDPLDPGINMNLGDFLIFAGRIGEAVDAYRNLLRLNPHLLPGRVRLAKALAFAGDRLGALAGLDEVAVAAPEPVVLETSAVCLAMLGDRERALPMAEELDRRAATGRTSAMAAANAWGALGNGEAALPWLERAWNDIEPLAVLAIRYPTTGPLFETARFGAFGRRVGLPRFLGIPAPSVTTEGSR
jgi:serine/threonine protein kinase/tetratricopeptide (TPR) repeat protein